ncbi:Fibronectin type III protein [Yersinia kristensenii]|nr:Fibronectin type III protein [Yersinia kristensenii]
MINKNGNAEFNNATVRGTVYATAGKFSGTIESNNGYFGGTVYARNLTGDIALQKYVTKSIGSTSGNNVIENVKYEVFSFDTADFARDCTILGAIICRGMYIYAGFNIYCNGLLVYAAGYGADPYGDLTLINPNFIIPARPLGQRDIITMSTTRTINQIRVDGQVIITKQGNGISVA